jgi:hypothetical protein
MENLWEFIFSLIFLFNFLLEIYKYEDDANLLSS